MDNLKHCPFCGGNAFFWTRGTRYGYIAWVECETCGGRSKAVSTKMQVDEDGFVESTSARVLKGAWNRREGDASD